MVHVHVHVLVLVLVLGACAPAAPNGFTGVDAESGMRIHLRPEPLPPDTRLAGVYVSPQLGRLRLARRGARVRGAYRHARGRCRVEGRLRGELRDNHLRFSFRERLTGCPDAGEYAGGGHLLFDVAPRDADGADAPSVRLFGRRHYVVEQTLSRVWEVGQVKRDAGVFSAIAAAPARAGASAGAPAGPCPSAPPATAPPEEDEP